MGLTQLIIKSLVEHPHWRYGQIVFNCAHMTHPVEADMIRGTDLDCFYNDEKVGVFLEKLYEYIIMLDKAKVRG